MTWDLRLQCSLNDLIEACRGLLDGYSEIRWEWFDDAVSAVAGAQEEIKEGVLHAGRHGRMKEEAAKLQALYARSESPIEAVMAGALHSALLAYPDLVESGFKIQQQAKFANYRLDFLIWRRKEADGKLDWPAMAIECDGKDFHTASEMQVNRDKARDRFLQHHGVMVFRFPGSEIWADADACAHQALSALKQHLYFSALNPLTALFERFRVSDDAEA
jgi:very-short-patch-repair endonuclease